MKIEIGPATLYLGKCEDILPSLTPTNILTDPPYGISYKSGHNSGRGGNSDKIRKDGNFAPIAGDTSQFDPAPILALACPTILWGADNFCDKLPPGKRWLIWNKLCGKTPFPSGSDVEIAWCSVSGVNRMFDHLWRGIMRAGEENVANSPKLHPHQKPVALMEWCLSFLPDGPIMDPYMGSASAGVAALRSGREYIGIECDPAIFEVARKRMTAEYAQGKLAL